MSKETDTPPTFYEQKLALGGGFFSALLGLYWRMGAEEFKEYIQYFKSEDGGLYHLTIKHMEGPVIKKKNVTYQWTQYCDEEKFNQSGPEK